MIFPTEIFLHVSNYFDHISQYNLFLTCKLLYPKIKQIKKTTKFHNVVIDKIIKYQNKIDWSEVSNHIVINESNLYYLCHKLDWTRIISRIKSNMHNLDFDINSLVKYPYIYNMLYKALKCVDLPIINAKLDYTRLNNDQLKNEIKCCNWNILISQRQLSNKMIKLAMEHLPLDIIVKYQKINIKMLEYISIEKIDKNIWTILIVNQDIPEKFIKRVISHAKFYIDWHVLIQYQKLSVAFLTKYKHNTNQVHICYFQDLSKPEYSTLLKNFIDNIDYRTIVIQNQKLNFINIRYIIEQYKSQSILMELIEHQIFSASNLIFLIKTIPNGMTAFWDKVIQYQKIGIYVLRKMINKQINISWHNFYRYQKLSEEYLHELITSNFTVLWGYISEYQILSSEFITEYADKLQWYQLSQSQYLSEEIIEANIHRLDWDIISINQKFSEEFAKKYKDKINWNTIWSDQTFPNLVFYKETDLKVI